MEADGYWEGNWPYANLGVLLALAGSFLITYLLRRPKVRDQEMARGYAGYGPGAGADGGATAYGPRA